VGKNNNFIEINGRRYNAVTGVAVGTAELPKIRQSLDGVIAPAASAQSAQPLRSNKTVSQPQQQTHQSVIQPTKVQKPSLQDVRRPTAKPATNHTPEQAKTLMRHAVHKPQPDLKRHLVAQSPTDILIKQPQLPVTPKLSVATVDSTRWHRAKAIAKSQLVSRFNQVQPSPPIAPTTTKVISQTLAQPLRQPAVKKPPKTTADLLQFAVEQATSHQEAPIKLKKSSRAGLNKHLVGIGTLAAAFVLLVGVLVHQNMADIKLNLASSKAGFAASLPAYQPPGFSLANISSDTGTVALHFHSNSDTDRDFVVTEKPSGWDSPTLRDMFVSQTGQSYQTVESAGRILYIYGQRNITWVNGGIWYQIQSNDSLSNQQLVDLANSL